MTSPAAPRPDRSESPLASSPAQPDHRPNRLRVALVGNPNTGKTTLFNAMTGLRQRVGNYSGVTVERVEGRFTVEGVEATMIDLPGIYTLSDASPDALVARRTLSGEESGGRPDVVVCVTDATQPERGLPLVGQLIESGLPVVVALNQFDAALALGMHIDIPELALALGIPVVPTVATRSEGIAVLERAIVTAAGLPPSTEPTLDVRPEVMAIIQPLQESLDPSHESRALSKIVGALSHPALYPETIASLPGLGAVRETIEVSGYALASLEAESRYAWSSAIVRRTVTRPVDAGPSLADRIDRVVLNRFAGPVIFLAIVGIVFQGIFSWAAPVMTGIQSAVGAFGKGVAAILPAGPVRGLVVDGILAGFGAVVVFIPQIALLFLFLGALEDSGYMARAALIADRLMRRVGLHGRSFIPLVSSYACAVPGIMSTRTIEDPKDRLATIMVAPLMSCSARLPVYALLISTFLPATIAWGPFSAQGLTMLGMYMLGTLSALGLAWIFRRTILKGPAMPLIIELPPYRLPRLKNLAVVSARRVWTFLSRAGSVILSLSILLWVLGNYPKAQIPASASSVEANEIQMEHSALGHIGHVIEPAVAPLGYDWKVGIGIVASFAAREVFVSTMGTLYGVGADPENTAPLSEKLRSARNPSTGGLIYTPLMALGLMVFYVYALQCMSTVAVVIRETGGGRKGLSWAALQMLVMLFMAWTGAWLVFHGGHALGFR